MIKIYRPTPSSNSLSSVCLSPAEPAPAQSPSSSVDPDNNNVHPKSPSQSSSNDHVGGAVNGETLSQSQSLEQCIEAIDAFLTSHLNNSNATSDAECLRQITFVCDGQLPLRQCLHPQAVAKSIEMDKPWWWSFVDLKMEWEKFSKVQRGDQSPGGDDDKLSEIGRASCRERV